MQMILRRGRKKRGNVSEEEVVTPYYERQADTENITVVIYLPGVHEHNIKYSLSNSELQIIARKYNHNANENEAQVTKNYLRLLVSENDQKVKFIRHRFQNEYLTLLFKIKKLGNKEIKTGNKW